MKLQILVAVVLFCCGGTSAFTTLVRAGTNAARGALQAGNSVADIGFGTADSFGSVIPGVNTAVGMARSGTNLANSVGNSGLLMVDGAAAMTNLMHSMLTNPWVIWIMGICTRMMATMNSYTG
ncbi:uncharacterized protein [Halyomorpha halys]|uniref:uncharacterized protein n=1 Tax=Halyomorpha halys TaxID=286706 RepID=UPI0006D50BB7|nr:uncharacterized protein LOC106689798 [Halyomorpha halys]